METWKWCLMAALLCGHASDAYKVLLLFPIPGISHGILGDGFVRHLLEAGHEVYYVTPFLKNNTHPNLHQIDVSANKDLFNENSLDIKAILNKQLDFSDMDFLNDFMAAISTSTLGNENLLRVLREPAQRFDVVIAEWMFSELYSVIPAVFQCPFIWFSSVEPHWQILSLIDEPLSPAYNPDFVDSFYPPFTFTQRVYALYKQIEGHILKNKYNKKEEASYLKQVVPILKQKGLPVPTYRELEYNASLILGNSHVSLGGPTRLPQNYKNIAGYHIQETVKPLPKSPGKEMLCFTVILDLTSLVIPLLPSWYGILEEMEKATSGTFKRRDLQLFSVRNETKIVDQYFATDVIRLTAVADLKTIMDNSKNGVIYFSLGSNLKSKDLPEATKKGLLDVFRGLKQTVMWKFEEVMPGIPENVHVVQWAPQPSILAHPNCVLFITHGGLLSFTEAVHYAVPVIAIPVFADQFINGERIAQKGLGLKVDLSYTLHETIRGAINEVLGNPKYTEKAKELSFIYHDRTTSPGAEIVHWVQHVVRTRGAPHLRSLALDVPLYQKLYLDLLALVIIALLILKTIIQRVLCVITIRKLDSKKVN